MLARLPRLKNGLSRRWRHRRSDARTMRLAAEIERRAPRPTGQPVVFFNASTRLEGLSLNAAFALTSAWALRLRGAPVTHFVSNSGMTRCVLGAAVNGAQAEPPCGVCAAQSRRLYARSDVRWFEFEADPALDARLEGLDLAGLLAFEHEGLALGSLTAPSLRWALRRYNLEEDSGTLLLAREFIRSAWRTACEFDRLLAEMWPQKAVVFNGISFPEAAAREMALRRGIPVVTHEVGLQPLSAFFSYGQATAYPLDIPSGFSLGEAENARLDAYLQARFHGRFSMAGVQFWPEMQRLSPHLIAKLEQFRQVVPVFSNVIFDTSQEHANVLFENMFAWLEQVLQLIKDHPDTLFVLRAHPDELRPGKASRESVGDWARRRGVYALPNAIFLDSNELLSSYELIGRSKFVMVYNSTIGLEAAILGLPVLSGGRARYSQLPTVYLPQSAEAHRLQAEAMLKAPEASAPPEFRENARRFLYYQLFHASLPFDAVLKEDGVWPGYVRLKDVTWKAFAPGASETFDVISDGILRERPFVITA